MKLLFDYSLGLGLCSVLACHWATKNLPWLVFAIWLIATTFALILQTRKWQIASLLLLIAIYTTILFPMDVALRRDDALRIAFVDVIYASGSRDSVRAAAALDKQPNVDYVEYTGIPLLVKARWCLLLTVPF